MALLRLRENQGSMQAEGLQYEVYLKVVLVSLLG